MKKIIRITLITLFSGLCFVILCLVLAAAFIQTAPGQRIMEKALNEVLVWDDGRVIITGISGRIPFNLAVENISIEDGHGAWLSICRAKLRWSLPELLSRKFHIFELGAGMVDLARLPETAPREEKVPSRPMDIKWVWPLPALTVDHLYLNSVHISDRIMDENMELSLEGSLFADSHGFSLAGLELDRLDKPSSLVRLRADLTRDPYSLDLDLTVSEADILESLIPLDEWPSSVSLELKGSGPLNAWKGRLNLDGSDKFSTSLDLEIRQEDFYFLHLGGDFFVNPLLLPAHGLDFTRDPFSLSLKAGLDHSNRVVLESLNINSPNLELEGDVFFDPSEMNIFGSLGLNIPDINLLLMDTGFEGQRPMMFAVDFDGPVDVLSATSNVRVRSVSGHGLSLGQALLKGDFQLKPTEKIIYAAHGNLQISDFHIRQYAQLPENFVLDFDLDHSFENILTLNKLDLAGRDLKAELAGQIDLGALQFKADLYAHAGQAQQLIPGLGEDAFFSTDIEAAVKGRGDIREFSYSMDADITMSEFHADEPALTFLAGDRMKLSGSLTFTEDLTLHVSRAELDAEEFSLIGAGYMNFKDMDMDYSGELVVPSLAGLGEILETNMAGKVNVDLAARGKVVQPDLRAVAMVKDFRYEHLDPADIEAEVKTVIQDGLPRGSLEMFITQTDKRLDLYTDFALWEHSLEIAGLSIRGHDLEVRADLDFDLETHLVHGSVLVETADLSSISRFFDLNITGALKSEATLAAVQTEQNITFSLSGEDLGFEDFSISGIQASADMESLSPQGFFRSDITISGIKAPQAEIDLFTADMKGRADKIEFSSTLAGTFLHPLDLTITGSYSAEESKHIVEVSELLGVYAHEHFHLVSPSVFEYSPDKTVLSPFNIASGGGILSIAADLTLDEVNASIELKDLNIDRIPLQNLDQVQGTINFDLMLGGRPGSPVVKAEFNIDGLTPATPHLEIPHALNLTAGINLANGQATIEAFLMENQTRLARLDFSLPVDFALEPFKFDLPDPLPLAGRLQSSLDLEQPAQVLLPPDQILTGFFSADFTISGTISKPVLQGKLNVEKGSFEHLDGGIYIADLELRAQADQTMITISEIKASDGLNGQVRGSGSADLSGDFPWGMKMGMKNFRLINHKLAQVFIDNGDLNISGDSSGAEVSGKIVFQSVEAYLPDQAPPGVVDIDVTEINRSTEQKIPETQPAGDPYPVMLDLDLSFPARVYVRGRGLDSEWAGDLKITGEATAPSVRGDLNVVRGRLELLDRRFNLERESIIFLDGSFPPDPNVDIRAQYHQKGMLINVRVYGPALEPEIELTSDPHMPQDEILAWVLFGRDISSISPFQAIALANAARTLTMGRTGPDMLGQVRDFIGVDDIDISTDPEEGHTQFGLGKYVHEKVYVEVKKGTAPGTDAVRVEVELTPRISLESSVESDSEGGVGIFWKYDY